MAARVQFRDACAARRAAMADAPSAPSSPSRLCVRPAAGVTATGGSRPGWRISSVAAVRAAASPALADRVVCRSRPVRRRRRWQVATTAAKSARAERSPPGLEIIGGFAGRRSGLRPRPFPGRARLATKALAGTRWWRRSEPAVLASVLAPCAVPLAYLPSGRSRHDRGCNRAGVDAPVRSSKGANPVR